MRTGSLPLLLLILILLPNVNAAWEEESKSSSLQSLVSDLISASTNAQHTALLSVNPRLVNAELTQALLKNVPKLSSQGLYEKGFQVCDLARQISERLGDQKGMIDTLNMIGTLLFGKEKYDDALEKYRESLTISERIGYTKGKGDSLNGMAWVQRQKDELDAAMQHAQESLTLYQSVGDKSGTAGALHIIGIISADKGEWGKALELYRQSLKLREELSETLGIGHCYLSMGNSLGPLGREDSAREHYEKAVKIFESEGEKKRLASTFNNLANLMVNKGDLSLALHYHLRSQAISRESGSKDGEGNSFNNIGVIHEIQGNYDLAMDYYKKALGLAEELGSKKLAYFAMGNIASIHMLEGRYQESLEQYQKTLVLCEQIGRPVSAMLGRIADVYEQMGQFDVAYEYYEKCLKGYEQRNEKVNITSILPRIAKVQNSLKDFRGALETARRGHALAQEIDIPENLWQAQLEEARAYLASGQNQKARQTLEDAITGIEQLRKTVAGAEVESQLYFAQHMEPYSMLVDILLSEKKNVEAFGYAERARARVLFDVLKGSKVQITKDMTDHEREQEQVLLTSLQNLNAQLRDEKIGSNHDAKKLLELQGKLQKARLVYESFRMNLYVDHPELKSQRGGFEIAGLEKAAEILDESELLLEYVVSQEETHVFAVTKTVAGGADLEVYSIPITAKDLGEEVQNFRKELADRQLAFGTLAADLYNKLLKPAEEKWKGKSRIIIVPDQQLWELPFQALQTDQGEYVLEKASISYAPSLTVLGEMMKSRKDSSRQPTLLALGNPTVGNETQKRVKAINRDESLDPLPEAEEEVRTLGRLYGEKNSRVYVRADAREDTLKSESHDFGIIHIAAHGILSDSNPMYSHLVLAPGKSQSEDGLLEPWEIMNMDLNASMVVLSACETARGKVGAGEGMIGFSWAFFVAGSPSVVVSQWNVNSESTTKLMQEFHKQWRTSERHLSKTEALRKAALSLMQDPRYGHPHYWAGFVIVGDPR